MRRFGRSAPGNASGMLTGQPIRVAKSGSSPARYRGLGGTAAVLGGGVSLGAIVSATTAALSSDTGGAASNVLSAASQVVSWAVTPAGASVASVAGGRPAKKKKDSPSATRAITATGMVRRSGGRYIREYLWRWSGAAGSGGTRYCRAA